MKKFFIHGTVYKHVVTKEIPEGVDGYCDPDKKVIATHSDLTPIELLKTIIHELCHAGDFENGLYQVMDHTMMEVKAESVAKVMMDNFIIKPRKNIK